MIRQLVRNISVWSLAITVGLFSFIPTIAFGSEDVNTNNTVNSAATTESSSPTPLPSAWSPPTTGPRKATGPQAPTGPLSPTGPQQPTGPQDATGIQANVSGGNVNPQGSAAGTNVTQSNTATGPQSNNQNSSNNTSNTNAEVNNNTDVTNNVGIDADSGGNSNSNNTITGNTETGNIQGSVDVLNTTGSVFAPGSSVGSQTLAGSNNPLVLGTPTNRSMLQNGATGPWSQNSNSASNTSTSNLVQGNDASANNDINIIANTGANSVLANTIAGNLVTGNIDLGVNVYNLLGLGLPTTQLAFNVFNIMGDAADLHFADLENQTTGPNSTNNNTSNQNQSTNVTTRNNAYANNMFNIDANTGGNQMNNNTQSGEMTTGNVAVKGGVTTIANIVKPVLYVVNVFGEWLGDVASQMGLGDNVIVNQVNDTTGPDSDNTNTTDSNNTSNISQTNNATADNKINIKANTGKNKVNDNTKVGNVSTGSIKIGANVVNLLNSVGNQFDKLVVNVINIFGNWRGNLKPLSQLPTPAPTSQTVTHASVASTTDSHNSTVTKTKKGITGIVTNNRPVSRTRSLSLNNEGKAKTSTVTETTNGTVSNSKALADATPVRVKSYQADVHTPQTKEFPTHLLYVIAGGLAFIALWGAAEVVAWRNKKQS